MSQYVMGSRADIAAVVLTAAGLVLAIVLHLLPALFAGLLVHALVHLLAPRMFGSKVDPALARVGVVIVLTLIVLGLTAILVGGATAFYRREGADLASLLQKMADIIDGARTTMPGWMQDIMPTDAETLKDDAAGWLREHAVELRKAGGEVGRGLAYALIGMVIGALLAVREIAPARVPGPLARALQRCALLVEDSFSRVVLAQIRISALNTLLTAIYLAGVLPAVRRAFATDENHDRADLRCRTAADHRQSHFKHRDRDHQLQLLLADCGRVAGVPRHSAQARVLHQRAHRRLPHQRVGVGVIVRNARDGSRVWLGGRDRCAGFLCLCQGGTRGAQAGLISVGKIGGRQAAFCGYNLCRA
jgi:hypothetical protein